jgi:hypothetical protein
MPASTAAGRLAIFFFPSASLHLDLPDFFREGL